MKATYFYGPEADMFTFFRIPKLLFSPAYRGKLSTDAKLLYGLMLDRMGLSSANGWRDNDGRVYIYFPREEVAELLDITERSASKLYKELEANHLIDRVEQGMGKPRKIYVHKYFNKDKLTLEVETPTEAPTPEAGTPKEDGKKFPVRGENISPHTGKNFPPDGKNFPGILNTDIKDTYSFDTQSINQASEAAATTETPSESEVVPLCREEIESQVAAQIEKQALYEKYPPNRGTIDSIAGLMADELTSTRPAAKIGGATRTRAEIRIRLNAVTSADVAAILDAMRKNPPKVKNPRGYLLTSLYNAPANRMDEAKPKKGPGYEVSDEMWKYADELKRRRDQKKAREYAQKLKEEMETTETTV